MIPSTNMRPLLTMRPPLQVQPCRRARIGEGRSLRCVFLRGLLLKTFRLLHITYNNLIYLLHTPRKRKQKNGKYSTHH